MKLRHIQKFKRNIARFQKSIVTKFYKQAEFLLLNLRHPSLHAKKYNESRSIWQARVDKNIRFYFFIRDDVYVLLDIMKHPK